MMKKILIAVLALAGIGLIFAAGSWVGWRSATATAGTPAVRRPLYYSCPMHPAYHSDRPGDCPSCGMRLEPVYEGAARTGSTAPPDASRLVQISAERQQVIGVRLGAAEQTPGDQIIHTVGRVAADETRIFRITAAVDGWVQELKANATGVVVRKDDVLGAYYAPEFLGAQQAHIYALSALDRFQKGSETPEQIKLTQASIQQAADNLRNMGMSEIQVQAIAKARELTQRIWITSPSDGIILAREITLGQRFSKGDELFRIADLAHVWVLADVYEQEADYVRHGASARVTAPQRRREYQATVSNVEPLFDDEARTLKVRLELDNPGSVLKPGMFVDVDFPVTLPSALTVPAEAVLNTGLRSTVFVDRGNGYFEPRRVETGWRVGDRIQIRKGLMAGERIVISGNFLMDSESRMKAAAQAASGVAAKDPICGMDVDPKGAVAAGRTSVYEGTTYYFCSDGCKKDFDKDPARYARK
jgi:membrane fusion protein, copper/silver efflux system